MLIKNATHLQEHPQYDQLGSDLLRRLAENIQAAEALKCRVALVCVSPGVNKLPEDAQSIQSVTGKTEVKTFQKDTIIATSTLKVVQKIGDAAE